MARKKRVRWNSVAPSAEKKTKRPTADALGGAQQAGGREPVELLDPGPGLVADRGGEMDDGVDAAQRLASDPRVAEFDQVAERDPHLDPQAAELARVADQHADLVAALEQLRQQRLPNRPRCARD